MIRVEEDGLTLAEAGVIMHQGGLTQLVHGIIVEDGLTLVVQQVSRFLGGILVVIFK